MYGLQPFGPGRDFRQALFHQRPSGFRVHQLSVLHVVEFTTAVVETHPLPSCFPACNQYLPSVQHIAASFVTTAHPADPVNEVMKARRESQGARYSEKSTGGGCQPIIAMSLLTCARASSDGTTLRSSLSARSSRSSRKFRTMHQFLALSSFLSTRRACSSSPAPPS